MLYSFNNNNYPFPFSSLPSLPSFSPSNRTHCKSEKWWRIFGVIHLERFVEGWWRHAVGQKLNSGTNSFNNNNYPLPFFPFSSFSSLPFLSPIERIVNRRNDGEYSVLFTWRDSSVDDGDTRLDRSWIPEAKLILSMIIIIPFPFFPSLPSLPFLFSLRSNAL